MDLHTWITQQVDTVEACAKAATPGPWTAKITRKEWHGSVAVYAEVHPIAEIDLDGSGGVVTGGDAAHVAANAPDAVLRRCEADRRILARHRIDPHEPAFSASCEGCGRDSWDLPETESINDCPELLDLAHAHGITDEILAGLDRPLPPEPKPATGRLGLGDILATPPITTSDVPEALRGPRWKS